MTAAPSFLSIIALVILFGLYLFVIAMWARFVLDLAQVFARRWRPRGPLLVIAEATYTLTDPPIKAVRRLVPPLRIGGVALDLAFAIVMLVCLILISVIPVLVN